MDDHFDQMFGSLRQSANNNSNSSSSNSGSNSGSSGQFIAAKSFTGSKAGYYFSLGSRGLGYYEDIKTNGRSAMLDNDSRKRPREDQEEPINASTKLSTKEKEKSAEELLAEAEDAGLVPLDASSLKQLVSTLERKIAKNQQLRMKYADNAEKFVDSELELHQAVENIFALAASPELLPVFLSCGGFQAIFGLITHENTDISLAVLSLLQEICDFDMIQEADTAAAEEESEDGPKAIISNTLLQAVVEGQGLELIIQNLSRLDESNKDDAQGVYNTLSIIENLVELRSSLAVDICEKTHILKHLLLRLRVKAFDTNKLYSSELLSILLQADPANQRRICNMHDMDGLDSLMQLVAPYRKRDPTSLDEQECVQNLFFCLCSVLLDKIQQDAFRKGEGFELMMRCIKDQKFSAVAAIKVLKYAVTSNEANCLKFVEVGGLKFVAPVLLGRGLAKICFSGKEGSTIKKDVENAALSIFSQLVINLHAETELDSTARLLAKFVENENEKLERCIEIFAAAYVTLRQTDQRILAATRAMERAEDFDAIEEFNADIPLQRIEGGLYQLQQAAVIIAFVGQYQPSSRTQAQRKLQALGHALSDVGVVIKELALDIRPSEDEDDEESSGAEDISAIASKKLEEAALLDQWADDVLGWVLTKSSSGEESK